MSRRVSSWLISIIGLVACLMVGACSNNQSEKHPKHTLRIDVSAEAPTLDPQLQQDTTSARIDYDLFSGLVDFDQKNNPIPGMAKNWTISKNGKKITFYLRKDLKFSDGTPITANDFVYSWRRLVNPATHSNAGYLLDHVVNAKSIMAGKMPPQKLGVFAPNDYTLEVNFSEVDSAFIDKCTLTSLAVVPHEIIEQYGSNWTKPDNMITSGAYKLTKHVVNSHILAEKNPYYYDANSVQIPKIKYLPYTDTNASIASYNFGDIDITGDTMPVDRYAALLKQNPEQIHTAQQEGIYYYTFNMRLPIFHNVKLRQALSMAIDRETLSKELFDTHPKPIYSVTTATIDNGEYADIQYPWAKESREAQIAEAQKLYHEAGYGPENPLKISISFNANDSHKKVAIAIAKMWENVLGVNTTLQSLNWGKYINARQEGDFVIARDGWIADYDAISSYLILFQCHNPQNHSGYCDPRFEKAVAKGEAATNSDEQKKYYHQALEYALDDYTIIPLYQYTYQRLVKPYLLNYEIEHNHLNHVQSKWIYFKKTNTK